MKKSLILVLLALIAAGVAFGAAAKTKVIFWYLWTNSTEIGYINGIIDGFNRSSDKYVVEGLAEPDIQKVKVAIAGGAGPDITDDFAADIVSYAEQGILEPLDSYMKKDGYDISDFIPAAMKACQYQGKTWALPLTSSTFLLFYNKTLLSNAGYTRPPRTDKELLDYAIKLTKVNADKSIDILGYPDYPFVYFINNMSYALGGDYMGADGKLAPNNPATIAALKNIIEYRKKFGVDKVLAFDSSAKYCDPSDPFVQGKQALRIDGPWFGNTLKNVLKANVSYGTAPLPYPDGHPELAQGGIFDSSIIYISATSKNKDGAWAFAKYWTDKAQLLKFCVQMANLPSRKSIIGDPQLAAIPDLPEFGKQVLSANMRLLPYTPKMAEFTSILNEEVELAANLKKSPEDAMASAAKRAESIR
jgi:multiple sugar transport system substrate-binding protein